MSSYSQEDYIVNPKTGRLMIKEEAVKRVLSSPISTTAIQSSSIPKPSSAIPKPSSTISKSIIPPCFTKEDLSDLKKLKGDVFTNNDSIYKMESGSDEVYFLQRLDGSGLTPKLLSFKTCIFDGEERKMFEIEKYDGTLNDYLKSKPNRNELISSFKEIINKSLKLNREYGIQHGDFHRSNIVYKRIGNSIKWAFIDFEFSRRIHSHRELVNIGLDQENMEYYDQGFFSDLFILQNDITSSGKPFELNDGSFVDIVLNISNLGVNLLPVNVEKDDESDESEEDDENETDSNLSCFTQRELNKLNQVSGFVFVGDDVVYRLESEPNEFNLIRKLNNTGLIPEVYEIKQCMYEGKPVNMMKMEKYDGTLEDYIKSNPNQDELIDSIKEIIQKSLLLNMKYKIRHGDFHSHNIVYKRSNNKVEWAFIDFEMSIEYDENNRLIYKSEKESEDNFDRYNPYFDILTLQYVFPDSEYYLDIVVPYDYLEHYLLYTTDFAKEDYKNSKIGKTELKFLLS